MTDSSIAHGVPREIPRDPRQNHLLAALPADEFDLLLPELELVNMPLGWVIYESGAKLNSGYLPIDAIVSLLYVMENGSSAEIAVIGWEGLVGVHLLLGGDTTPNRAVVQSAGHGYRIKVGPLLRAFRAGGAFQRLTLSYTQALITQMAQTAVCNRHHTVEQQLCRWLLLSLDRTHGPELCMTQELIANMLGVRREGVTEAARKLQAKELIRYTRGHITVLDRKRLEDSACECYRVVFNEFSRLLPENLKPKPPEPKLSPRGTHQYL